MRWGEAWCSAVRRGVVWRGVVRLAPQLLCLSQVIPYDQVSKPQTPASHHRVARHVQAYHSIGGLSVAEANVVVEGAGVCAVGGWCAADGPALCVLERDSRSALAETAADGFERKGRRGRVKADVNKCLSEGGAWGWGELGQR